MSGAFRREIRTGIVRALSGSLFVNPLIRNATLVLKDWSVNGKSRVNSSASTSIVAAPVPHVSPVQDCLILLYWAETTSRAMDRYSGSGFDVDPVSLHSRNTSQFNPSGVCLANS